MQQDEKGLASYNIFIDRQGCYWKGNMMSLRKCSFWHIGHSDSNDWHVLVFISHCKCVPYNFNDLAQNSCHFHIWLMRPLIIYIYILYCICCILRTSAWILLDSESNVKNWWCKVIYSTCKLLCIFVYGVYCLNIRY